jgi:hypothetical protein
MANNDQHIKKQVRKGWFSGDASSRQRIANKEETQEELQHLQPKVDVTDRLSLERSEDQKEIDRLKSELRKAKREVLKWKTKYNLTHEQWWSRLTESWSRRGKGVPKTIQEELYRIRKEWEAQNNVE